MTEELQEYYNTLVFKDNANTRYFFDIIANMGDMSYPVISIKQNRKAATGAETFKKAVERICENKKVSSLTVIEYNNCCDDAEAVITNEFELKKNKKMTKRKNNQPANQFGLMGLEQTTNLLDGMSKSMGLLGFEGGLSGIIRNTAMSISQATELDKTKTELSECKAKNLALESEINRLRDEQYKSRDREYELKRQLSDKENDFKAQKERLENRNTIGNLFMTAGLGFLAKKYKLEENLAGLLGEDDSTAASAPQPSPDLSSVNLQATNPETADAIEEINRYLATLDKSRIDLVQAICQYVSQGDAQLKRTCKFVQNEYTRQQQQINVESQNTENHG